MLIALTLTGWCGIARLVRGQMLQLKSQEFVLTANALRCIAMKVIMKHMIPNTLGMIIELLHLVFRIHFLRGVLKLCRDLESSIQTSWGALASLNSEALCSIQHSFLFPAIRIALTMLELYFAGDGLRDALDRNLENSLEVDEVENEKEVLEVDNLHVSFRLMQGRSKSCPWCQLLIKKVRRLRS